MRIRIGLLLTALAIGVTQVALAKDVATKQAPALLTYAAPEGGICAVRADGSNGRRLTPPWRLFDVAWSPDGRYVAFSRSIRPGYTPSRVFVADARGRIRWRFGVNVGSPLWAPDGQHIAYGWVQAHSRGLAVARPDGSDAHGLSDSGWPPHSGPYNPTWSADGQRIAFDYDGSIYSVRSDGSAPQELLVPNAALPAYSPDGEKLAYAGYGGGKALGVFVSNVDGTDPHLVSSRGLRQDGWGLSWSPDGRQLAFADVGSPEIRVAKADGSGDRVIADLGSRWVRSTPKWSPDGALVAFTQVPAEYRPFRSSIVVARADGSGWRVVVKDRHSRRDLHSLAWRPGVPLPPKNRVPC